MHFERNPAGRGRKDQILRRLGDDDVETGVLVEGVSSGTSADEGGMRDGDIIVGWGDNDDGELIAHAWLELDGRTVLGAQGDVRVVRLKRIRCDAPGLREAGEQRLREQMSTD